jgi:adenine phosphoribosyltransferase
LISNTHIQEQVLISIGGSAYAGAELIQKMGGELMGFIFLLELEFLHGRDKLPAPVYTLLSGQA